MIILLSIILLYLSIGLILVLRNMRGMMVEATLGEWLFLILLWPLVLPLYRLVNVMRLFEESLKEWEKENDN